MKIAESFVFAKFRPNAVSSWFELISFDYVLTGLDHDRLMLEHPRLSQVRQSITGLLFKSHSQGSRLSISSFAQAIDIHTVKVGKNCHTADQHLL